MDPLSIVISFAAGCAFTGALAVLLGRRIKAEVTVNVPDISLPASLTAIVRQPAPPAASMDRAQLWQEVYSQTFGDSTEYSNIEAQDQAAATARGTADRAVDKAFPPAPVTPPLAPPPAV